MTDYRKQALLSLAIALIVAVGAFLGVKAGLPQSGPGIGVQSTTNFDTLDVSGALSANSFTVSTPLAVTQFITPTPQPTAVNKTFFGATPLAARVICQSVTVTGLMTATPIAPITTPLAVWAGLSQAPGGDARNASASQASGVVTINVTNSALTPVAATTPATVILCEMGLP